MSDFDYINHLKFETKRLRKDINCPNRMLLEKVIRDYLILVENATKCYEGKILDLEKIKQNLLEDWKSAQSYNDFRLQEFHDLFELVKTQDKQIIELKSLVYKYEKKQFDS